MLTITQTNNAVPPITKEDYLSLVDKCYWLQLHLRNLDHQLNSCTFRLKSVQDQRLIKCWFALSLVELRRLTNLVVRLMFELQTATLGKLVNTDYYKFALDQLCYFEFLWRCYFTERIQKLDLQFRDYMAKYDQQIKEQQMKSDKNKKLGKDKEMDEWKKEDPLIDIIKDVQPTLETVAKKMSRKKNKKDNSNEMKQQDKTPELDLGKENASVKLNAKSIDDLSYLLNQATKEDEDDEIVEATQISKNDQSLESLTRSRTRLDSKTAEFLDLGNKEASDLIALGQLEASMRVNQQLMECIRNHIEMAKLTVKNIQETGQRSLQTVERTSRNVELTQNISRLTKFTRSIKCWIFLFIFGAIIFLIINYSVNIISLFKHASDYVKKNLDKGKKFW